jgi:prepilin peptidase CpaA
MALTATPELWFLPFAILIGGWVAYSDLASMKIPNKAVLALLAVFFFVGLLALPLDVWAWRWVHFGVAIVATFILASLGVMGAGDAKFLAAMMPFVALPFLTEFAIVLGLVIVLTFPLQRLFRNAAAARNRFAHWDSMERREFPMGVALGPALAIYLAIVALGA